MTKKADSFPVSAFGGSNATKGCKDTGSKMKGGKKGKKGNPNRFPTTAFGGKNN